MLLSTLSLAFKEAISIISNSTYTEVLTRYLNHVNISFPTKICTLKECNKMPTLCKRIV